MKNPAASLLQWEVCDFSAVSASPLLNEHTPMGVVICIHLCHFSSLLQVSQVVQNCHEVGALQRILQNVCRGLPVSNQSYSPFLEAEVNAVRKPRYVCS